GGDDLPSLLSRELWPRALLPPTRFHVGIAAAHWERRRSPPARPSLAPSRRGPRQRCPGPAARASRRGPARAWGTALRRADRNRWGGRPRVNSFDAVLVARSYHDGRAYRTGQFRHRRLLPDPLAIVLWQL